MKILLQTAIGGACIFNKIGPLRSSGERLNSNSASSGKEIQKDSTGNERLNHVKQRFFDPILRGSGTLSFRSF